MSTVSGTTPSRPTVARLIVRCLENEGVEYVFGIPGEENIHLVDALRDSRIRFVVVRDERGASFMADTYGRLTGRAGVCLATLGPGALNLILGTANAQLDSHPLVALVAQPALMGLLVLLLAVRGQAGREMILLGALPTASIAPMLALHYKAYTAESSATVLLSTVLSVLTLAGVIALLT